VIARHVKQGSPLPIDTISSPDKPQFSRDCYLSCEGYFFTPAPTSRETYPYHVYYIAETLGIEAPPPAIFKTLGALRRSSAITFVAFDPCFGFYANHQIVTDLGRDALPLLLARTLPGTQVDILPALRDSFEDLLLKTIQRGGIWLRNQTEITPNLTHSLSAPEVRNQILQSLIRKAQLKVFTSSDTCNLVLPPGAMSPTTGEWLQGIDFGTTITSNILPTPPQQGIDHVWEILLRESQKPGFMILLVKDSPVGEKKFDKLSRALTSLMDPDNEEFSYAGWPTLQTLAARENPQLYMGPSLVPLIRAQGSQVEVIPVILTGRGEAILIVPSKIDVMRHLHSPMETYGLTNASHWKNISNPLDVSIRLEQRGTKILQERTGRLILGGDFYILQGWAINPDPSAEQDLSAFKRTPARRIDIDEQMTLTYQTLASPTAWVHEGGNHNVPSPCLLRVILSLLLDGTISGCVVKEGTLLSAPDGETEDILNMYRPETNTGILDLSKVSISWRSRQSAQEGLQKWLKDGIALTVGKRQTCDDSGGRTATMPKANELPPSTDGQGDTQMSPQTAGASSSLSDSPVLVDREGSAPTKKTNQTKAPGHE
jgi:hypothetical protein